MKIEEAARSYTVILERAKRGDDDARLELLTALQEAIQKSDIHWDSAIVLNGLLERIAGAPSLREAVIPAVKETWTNADRDCVLVALVQQARALGYSLGSGGSAFEYAAEKFGGDTCVSAPRSAYAKANKQGQGKSHGALELSIWWPRMAGLVAYFVQTSGIPESAAIEKAVRAVHGNSPALAVKTFTEAWERNKHSVSPGLIEEAQRVFLRINQTPNVEGQNFSEKS